MKNDNLFSGKEAREKLMEGVRKGAEAVAATLGTSGSNSLIECVENPRHFATNDGATILASIKLADPIEEIGRAILFEAVSRANRASGDGSSTTCVLTQAILQEGMKYIGEVSPMEIKRSLEACIPLIEKSLSEQKREITVDTVGQVATISAEDEEIGNRIQEIYQKIGKDGIIQWDISKTPEDSYSIGTGIKIDWATYVAPYMADEGGTTIRVSNPKILLTRRKITTALEFENLFRDLFQSGVKEIVVFCEDIDVQVISDLYKTQRIQGFRTIVIKMPILWRQEWWEDLSLATGAKVIDEISGIQLKDAKQEHIGTVNHIGITKEDTFLDGIQDLSKHILSLKVDGSDEALQRAARLNINTARYFVGAHSESALAYRRLKCEDAINSASAALENGILPGGGIALSHSGESILNGNDTTLGGKILDVALRKPLEQIIKNTGKSVEDVTGWIAIAFFGGEKTRGFDSRTGTLVDMFETGIVDAYDVVLNAITSAIGVAASILTCQSVIILPRDEEQKPPQIPMMR